MKQQNGTTKNNNISIMNTLTEERVKIDKIDNAILELLKQRFECVDQIKKIKKQHNIPILNKNRENEIYDKIYEIYGYLYVYLKPIYETIMSESKQYQKH
jgi:chorismate mutase